MPNTRSSVRADTEPRERSNPSPQNPTPHSAQTPRNVPPSLAELQREEQQLDEQLAVARLERSIRVKRLELQRLQAGDLPPDGRDEPLQQETNTGIERPSCWDTVPEPPTYKGGDLSTLRAFIFDVEYDFRTTQGRALMTTERDRSDYALRCLQGAPKIRLLNYAHSQNLEPSDLTWAKVKELLQDRLPDPDTRVISALERLGSLVQDEHETVMDFVDRVDTIEMELPYLDTEISRVGYLLSKFRPEIRFHLNAAAIAIKERTQLISAARRIEEAIAQQDGVACRHDSPHAAYMTSGCP